VVVFLQNQDHKYLSGPTF